jgi:hypothetical protein
MRNVTVDNVTNAVIGALAMSIPARNRESLESLVQHIHC